MINTNTANILNKRVDTQRNKSDSAKSSRSGQQGSNFGTKQRSPKFQNPSVFFQILLLIMQLLRQLESEQEPEEEILDLSDDENESIKNRFGIFGEQGFSVIDKNDDGELSAGDVVSVTGGLTGGHIRDITLSQDDVDAISGKDLADAKKAFLKNKEKWNSTRPQNYTYTLERSGFIAPEARKPIDITVKGDTVTDARFADGSKALVPPYNRLSVDDLFNTIEKAIDKGAAEVRVEYDPQTGVPKSIYIDRDRRLADEELSLTTTNFKPQSVEQPARVKLSDTQNQNLQNLFGYKPDDEKSVFILDKDGNGKVSVGDEAIVFDNRIDPAPGDDGIIARKTLTAADVEKINSIVVPDKEIPLTKQQNSHALDLFGYIESGTGREQVRIVDKDGNGKISIGDKAIFNFEERELTEANVNQITNRPQGKLLKLDSAQQKQALHILNAPVERSRYHHVNIYDSNGDGKVSKGDTAIHIVTPSIGPDVVGYHSPQVEVERISLTEAEASQINNRQADELKLSKKQRDAIQNRFDISGGMGFIVLDKNGDKKLSAGDVVSVSGGFTGGHIRDITLTDADIKVLNDEGMPLKLTKEQQYAIGARFNHTPPPNLFDGPTTKYTGVTIDKDGDGKLSIGDVVKLHDVGGFRPPNSSDTKRDHILTAKDLAFIEKDRSNPLLNIGKGLSHDQKLRLGTAIGDNVAGISKVYDLNSDGKLSVGDVIGVIDGRNGIAEENPDITFHTLTQSDLDRYLQGGGTELKLTDKQQEAIGARFNRRPPPNLFDAPTTKYTGVTIDKDGNGKLSVGDVVKLRDVGGFRLPGSSDTTRDHVLTAKDIAFIEADRSSPLLSIGKEGLTENQKDRLQNAISDSISTKSGKVTSIFDANSDGKISVGDSIEISSDNIRLNFYQLTQSDLDRYLAGTETGVVTGGGVSVGGKGMFDNNPIPDERIVDIKGQNYSVGFLKSKVKDYANSTYVPTGPVDKAFGVYKWGTSNSMAAGRAFQNYIADTFPAGEPNLTKPKLLELTQQQHEAISKQFNDKSPLAFDGLAIEYTGKAFDKDGDGKLSSGDIVKLRMYGGRIVNQPIEKFKDHILTAAEVKAINSFTPNTISLQDRLEYLDGKRFTSEKLLTGGNTPEGITKIHWDIRFNNGNFMWTYTDVGESGKVGIKGNDITLTSSLGDRNNAFKVYPDQNAIEIDGNRYLLKK